MALRGPEGDLIGGLSASTVWGWLDLDYLIVPESFRGQGCGTALLDRAEGIAVERGCRWSRLSTFGFQARGFYERHEYRVVGVMEDFPPGSAFYWMRKDLD